MATLAGQEVQRGGSLRRTVFALVLLVSGGLGLPHAAKATDDGTAVHDPWERINRGIFAFNEVLDQNVLEYIAIGVDYMLPDPLERGIRNGFENLRFPMRCGNNLLQLKFNGAAQEVVRVLINSSVGIGGLFDAAGDAGLESTGEDFGQTLGFWGVPQGPYVVLPILGPANVRDTVGITVDAFSGPHSYFAPFWGNVILTVSQLLNFRSLSIESIRDERASAFDLYAFTRNAYVSNRRLLVLDQDKSEVPAESDEDLYYFDDEDDE